MGLQVLESPPEMGEELSLNYRTSPLLGETAPESGRTEAFRKCNRTATPPAEEDSAGQSLGGPAVLRPSFCRQVQNTLSLDLCDPDTHDSLPPPTAGFHKEQHPDPPELANS